MADRPSRPWLNIRSADGNRLAWFSSSPAPSGQIQEGELGEYIDTGEKLIYWGGQWREQTTELSEIVRLSKELVEIKEAVQGTLKVDLGDMLWLLQDILDDQKPPTYEIQVIIPGIAAADAFDANDAVGTVFEIPVPMRGIIESAKLIDPDDDTLALTAHLFSELFVGAASDAAFTISAADAPNWITSITFDTPIVDIGSAKVAEKTGSTYYYAPNGVIYCQCSTTGTPNIAGGAMPRLRLSIRAISRSN